MKAARGLDMKGGKTWVKVGRKFGREDRKNDDQYYEEMERSAC